MFREKNKSEQMRSPRETWIAKWWLIRCEGRIIARVFDFGKEISEVEGSAMDGVRTGPGISAEEGVDWVNDDGPQMP